jgi:serine/threonine protein kinase
MRSSVSRPRTEVRAPAPVGVELALSRRSRYPARVSRAPSKYRIIAHVRGGEATETSVVAVEGETAEAAGSGLAVMKRLKLGADAEPELLERFADEARLCKRFDNVNLTQLLEAGQDADGPVLVFEYLEGPSLARLRSRAVRRGGGVPVAITLRIVRQIAKGLAYLHALTDEDGKPLKVVHRDVSPDNVTVTYDGEVKISDFGMATTVASTAKSRADRVKGNVAYMAPEQARAEFALDARADLFALGVIMWELLTGKRMWEGLSEVDVLARLSDDAPLPTARSVVPTLPEEVDALCKQALEKVRDERFDAATDFLEVTQKLIAKPELKASAEELGEFVTSLFEEERDKMRALVEDSRTTTADEEKALPAIGAPRAADASKLVDAESDPNLRFGVVAPDEEPLKRVVEVIQVAPSPDRRFAYLMGAIVVVVLGVVAVVALTSAPEKKVVEAPWTPPVRPSATTPPATSAYKEPEVVTIEIRVTPSDAKLFVDGVRTDNPHVTRVVPAAFQHTVHAEAEGYEPRDMTMAFDRERTTEIALTPEPRGAVRHAPEPKPSDAKPAISIPLPAPGPGP